MSLKKYIKNHYTDIELYEQTDRWIYTIICPSKLNLEHDIDSLFAGSIDGSVKRG